MGGGGEGWCGGATASAKNYMNISEEEFEIKLMKSSRYKKYVTNTPVTLQY